VTDYELYRNQGTPNSVYTKITTYVYLTHGFTSTLTLTTESMTVGLFYSFIYRAKNVIDFSDYSGAINYGIADVPLAPTTISKIES
jgi:hypothetical protein